MSKNSARSLASIDSDNQELMFVQAKYVSLKDHPRFNELWLQDRINEDPTILGLGELSVMQRERPQFRAGRLDLLLRDVSSGRRFTLELQLGSLDESHIIRAIEYWDNERRRYPHIDHCAVICAESINARFLNVVSLFNGHIPLIALQVKAIQVENKIVLSFTKVLDEVRLGTDEPTEDMPEASRSYWEQKSSPETLKTVDGLVAKIRQCVGNFEIKYNKYYIGCVVNGRPANFINFKPQRTAIRIDLGVQLSDDQIKALEAAEIEVLEYTHHWKVHPIRLSKEQVANPPSEFLNIVQFAYKDYFD